MPTRWSAPTTRGSRAASSTTTRCSCASITTSQKDKIFGRYAFDDVSYTVTPGDNPNFTYFVAGRKQNLGVAWIHMFSPTFINEARYGYNRSVDNTLNPRANTDFDVEALGLTGFRVVNDGNRQFTPRETGVPTITVNSFSTLAEQDGGNGFDFNNLHQFNDNLTWAHGSHTIEIRLRFPVGVAVPRRRQRAARRIEFQRRHRQQRLRGVPARVTVEHGDARGTAADRDAATARSPFTPWTTGRRRAS